MRKEDNKLLESAEMWIWRRMRWKAKKTNEEILIMAKETSSPIDTITKDKRTGSDTS